MSIIIYSSHYTILNAFYFWGNVFYMDTLKCNPDTLGVICITYLK